MKKLGIILILSIFSLTSCGPKKVNGIKRSSSSFTYKGEIKPGTWLRDLKVIYTADGKEQFATIQIYFPKDYKPGLKLRTIIALAGYLENHRTWEFKSPITKHADEFSFAIVCPDMKTSVYESKFYPETKNKWGGIPGGKFIGINLINYLRENFNLASDKSHTGLLGASMGGRGALIVAALYPEECGAAAGLSGIYDKSLMNRDYQFVSVYGSYDKFEQRWKSDDNLLALSPQLKDIPVFIWHGKKDLSILPEQSMIIAIKLKKYNNITYIQHSQSVDWLYYAHRALPDVMKFFNEKLKP